MILDFSETAIQTEADYADSALPTQRYFATFFTGKNLLKTGIFGYL